MKNIRPAVVWLILGYAAGYFTAALVVARHWGYLP